MVSWIKNKSHSARRLPFRNKRVSPHLIELRKEREGEENKEVFDCLCLLWATGALGSSGLETVLELAVDGLKVTHAAGTGGSSPKGLLTPVICRVVCHVSKHSPIVPPGCNIVLA